MTALINPKQVTPIQQQPMQAQTAISPYTFSSIESFKNAGDYFSNKYKNNSSTLNGINQALPTNTGNLFTDTFNGASNKINEFFGSFGQNNNNVMMFKNQADAQAFVNQHPELTQGQKAQLLSLTQDNYNNMLNSTPGGLQAYGLDGKLLDQNGDGFSISKWLADNKSLVDIGKFGFDVYTGIKNLGLQKDMLNLAKTQLAFNKDIAYKNLANQTKQYNTTLGDIARTRGYVEKGDTGAYKDWYEENKL